MKMIARNFTNHESPRGRGFATIFAIALVILVGAALATLGGYFAQEASRTRSQIAEAQLRQLLTAGAMSATQTAATVGPAKSLALPSDLAAGGASVRVQIFAAADNNADERSALITANLGRRHMEQTLKLHHNGDRWSVAAIDLASSIQPPAAASPSTQPSDRSTAASQRS